MLFLQYIDAHVNILLLVFVNAIKVNLRDADGKDP